ncbi:helix-turn-helix domain-containing protein [Planctomyces sp. SH-PL14]|uniref:helix-turn-helix domain-containing protein n=1 Tax=Planctomyces sp. SH-PL14 TaxID=1632864 RepID=UPI0039657B8E
MASDNPTHAFSPTELAARWNCTPETILAMIRRGTLRAFTLSPPGCKRPRWRVSRAAVEDYEAGPVQVKPPEQPRPSRRSRDTQLKRFFRV